MSDYASPGTSTCRQPGQPWDLPTLAQYLTVSKKSLDRAVKAGTLKVIRIGRRVLIPDSEARRLAESGL